jgi:hypothetical protein
MNQEDYNVMKKPTLNRLAKLSLISVLSLSMILPISSLGSVTTSSTATAEATKAAPVKLKNVTINATSYAQLKNLSVMPSSAGQVVSFTFSIFNGSKTDMQFIDYWVRLQSNSGARYSVKLIAADKDKNSISPNTSEEFTFYSTVGANVRLTDLSFSLLKWDFSQTNFERVLGTISIPQGYDNKIASGTVGTIDVGGSAIQAEVINSTITKNDSTYYFNTELKLVNSGNRSVTTPVYTFYALTTEGIIYQLTGPTEALQLQPREEKKNQLSASIPGSIKQDGWQLIIATQDATAKLDIPLLIFQIPNSSGDPTSSSNLKKTIIIDDTSVEGTLKSVNLNENDTKNAISLVYSLENKGFKTVTIPNYQYQIKTTEGITYPLSSPGADLKINARETKELYMNTTFPATVNTDQLQLVVSIPAEDKKPAIPVAVYNIDKSALQPGTTEGSAQFSNKYGVYTIKLNSVQRMPWEDDDIIAADITILNGSSSSLPIPNLSGLFEFDGVAVNEDDIKLVKLDNLLSVPAKSQSNMILYVKIPYTYTYGQVKLNLVEKGIGENPTSTQVASFLSAASTLETPTVKSGESLQLTDIGKRAGVSVRNAYVYKGDTTDMYYAELVMDNQEKRATKLTSLAGYLRTSDDVILPASVSVVKNAVTPSGKVLLSFWSRIPKQYSADQVDIIVGEGVKGGALAAGDDVSDAIVRAATLEHTKTAVTTSGITALKINPYNIALREFRVRYTDSETLTVDYQYDLSKVTEFEQTPAGHSMILEFISGSFKDEHEITIEGGAATNTNMVIGTSTSQTFTFKGAELFNKVKIGSDYTINIYDSFEGHKRLIGTVSMSWNITH